MNPRTSRKSTSTIYKAWPALLALTWQPSSTVHAQPAPSCNDNEACREGFLSSQRWAKRAKFDRALRGFVILYQRYRDPRLLFPIGRMLQRLGKNEGAAQHYRNFLDSAVEADADQLAVVRQYLAQTEPQKAVDEKQASHALETTQPRSEAGFSRFAAPSSPTPAQDREQEARKDGAPPSSPPGGALFGWDGRRWGAVLASKATVEVYGIWGNDPKNMWAAGDSGKVLHWDGTQWLTMMSDTLQDLNGIWGSTPSGLWAVGNGGTLLHCNGTNWRSIAVGTTADLYAIWGSGPQQLWASGSGGVLLRWDGGAWSQIPSSTGRSLYDVWGTSATNIWAVGLAGAIIHWDGASWSPVTSNVTQSLYQLWGSGPNDIWAVGSAGTILHWNGARWAGVASGTSHDLHNIWGTSSTNVYALGSGGIVLRWNGQRWAMVRTRTVNKCQDVWSKDRPATCAASAGGMFLYRGESP